MDIPLGIDQLIGLCESVHRFNDKMSVLISSRNFIVFIGIRLFL